MQVFHEEEDLQHTPPPPYTLIDDNNIHNSEINNFNNPHHFVLDVDNNGPQVRQLVNKRLASFPDAIMDFLDSSYPVTGDPQNEEYLRWLEQQQLQRVEGLRDADSATGWLASSDPNHIDYNNDHIGPLPPIPEEHQQNNNNRRNNPYLPPPVLYNNNNNDLNRYAHLQPSNHNNVNFVPRNFADDNYRSSSKCPRDFLLSALKIDKNQVLEEALLSVSDEKKKYSII
ncbi:1891_t:CDS:2 [Entrophospora sp. SA101]|nr:1891_t:CDS:2 [Entrophospora sp. SA101]